MKKILNEKKIRMRFSRIKISEREVIRKTSKIIKKFIRKKLGEGHGRYVGLSNYIFLEKPH